jgi:hypothetical protein
MTEAAASIKKKIQITVEEGGIAEVTIDSAKVAEISPEGNVESFADFQVKPAIADAAAKESVGIIKAFNSAAVYGVTIEKAADGKLTISTNGTVTVKPAPANDTAIVVAKAALEAGQKMEDGTYYLGRFTSKDGKAKDYFAAAEDAQDKNGKRLELNFNDAAAYAKASQAHGHDDWMVPTGWGDFNGEPDILNAIFNNKAKISGLDVTGSDLSGYYRSSSSYDHDYYTKFQRLSDGFQYHGNKSDGLSVRLVRSSTI